jgi:ribonuclease HI
MPPRSEIELYVDGGSRGNPGPAACAFILKETDNRTIEARGFFLGRTTNNVAEYTGLIRGLEAARARDAREINIFSDSELMVKQIIGEYRVRSGDLQVLFEQVQRLLLTFDRWQIRHLRREENAEADRLVNEVLDKGHNGSAKAKNEPAERSPRPAAVPVEPLQAASPVKVLVEVTSDPPDGACPARMQKGQSFVVSEFVPGGLCVQAAVALLPTVLALRHDPEFTGGLVVKCSHPGCGAGFRLSLV